MKRIDLRSDTVTLPTDEMRRAMAAAEVGDDVYGDDPTVNRLEELAAERLGKEAALFVASGTMGNQLAILTHTKRGDEILLAKDAHIVNHEAGAAALLSSVGYRMVDRPDGFVCAEDIAAGVREEDLHHPDTGLVCLENALGDGTVVPLPVMQEAYAEAKRRGIPVHLDGARIFNAAVSLGVDARELAACCDSVMFCVSKGLCAPVGSLLCGTKAFIARARKMRKILGGGMRQAGVIAAPGIIALEKMTLRLQEDHDNARHLAERLSALPHVVCDPARVQINIVFFEIHKPGLCGEDYAAHMAARGVTVSASPPPGPYRYVTHNGVSRADVDHVVDALAELLAD